MIVSDAKTPQEFQTEIVQEIVRLTAAQERRIEHAGPRETERRRAIIGELNALRLFVAAVQFHQMPQSGEPAFKES